MIRCTKCGTELNDTDKFCVYCGAKQEHINYYNKTNDQDDNSDNEDTYKFNDYDEDDYENEDDEKVGSSVGKFKIIAIVCATICVFVLSFKITSSFLKSSPGSSTSKVESSKNISKSDSDSGDYILPFSSKREVKVSDLKGLTKKQLLLASNEIFARHGYKFSKDPYKSYFESKSWYKVNSNYTNDAEELSPLERHNVKTILKAAGKHVASSYDDDYYKNS
ncbi:YARHG domain-containing protein [Clostridium fermenticellae]|uniref:YARHG domain-containing protein n=1 Tax=Clostridium fermenticellae TaxID=2068654 RepID=UPI0013C47E69|nr:YARHG domain-containing protein [Clostridium fermenticellae]